jgi:hypothetical protein
LPYDPLGSGQWFEWREGPDGPYRDWTHDEHGNPQPAIIPGYTPDPKITDWIILGDPSQPADDDERGETVQ